jgi:hypothetical protein
LFEAFARGELPATAKLISVVVNGYCPSCAAHRPAVVSVKEPDLPVECKRCGEALQVKDKAAVLALSAVPARAVPSLTPSAPAPVATVRPPLASIAETDLAPRRSMLTPALGVVVLALSALLTYTQWKGSASTPTAASTAAPAAQPENLPAATGIPKAEGWMSPADLPPPWVDRTFVSGDTEITLVGHSTGAATPESALAEARIDAVNLLVSEMLRELAPSPTYEFVKQRVRGDDARNAPQVAARFLAQMGSFAAPERVESALRKREQGIEAFVRYRVPATAFQRAIADYKATFRFQGMELGRFFPLLEKTVHSEAEIVALSVDKGSLTDTLGVRAGDTIVAVAGAPAPNVEALKTLLTDEWARTPPTSPMLLEVEAAGAKRTVRLIKPAQRE